VSARRGRERRRSHERLRSQPRWLLVGVLVYLGIAASGVGVARLSQETRALHMALELDQREQDRLLAQYSRLLLERSTLAAYQHVDDIAEQRLGMRFPEQVERVAAVDGLGDGRGAP
jgi:cell division protein FtsL